MHQIKIGRFIKELRKERGLTQEQLAEQFGVSRRTVSRWETGSNLPDLDILVEMSDYFSVSLRELLDGERNAMKMDNFVGGLCQGITLGMMILGVICFRQALAVMLMAVMITAHSSSSLFNKYSRLFINISVT